jgi:protein-disulfide isomerase
MRFVLALLAALAVAPTAFAADSAPSVAPAAPSSAERAKIEAVVREYLLQHPEVLVEAIQKLEAKEEAERNDKASAQLTTKKDELYADAMAPIGGNKAGDVTVVEFFDYNCPYCKTVAPALKKAVEADGKVRIIYKEFPILSPESEVAAKFALAANLQGKYVPFHEALLSRKGRADEAGALEVAKSVGLDVAKLKTDAAKPEIAEAIKKNRALARALDMRGTPAFVIGNQLIGGAVDLEDFQAKIADARKKSAS